ncbi:hypothetical protein [Paenibacillus sp. 1P03SA]|uniref:hypothetical protein n=1 Tax=Paenibacillus sp. 1P03SA TaxID=3132294 RepID=UPI0039A34687
MKEKTSRFIIATAILMAPAAGTAVNVSAHAAAAASQPSINAESASTPVAASQEFEPAAADTASPTHSAAVAGVEEFAGAAPSFVFNLAMKR